MTAMASPSWPLQEGRGGEGRGGEEEGGEGRGGEEKTWYMNVLGCVLLCNTDRHYHVCVKS